MGYFDWLFGDDDPEPQVTTATSTSRSEVPEYITQPHERMIQAAEKLASAPYQTYTDPRIAGFTDDQTAGMQGIRDRQGLGVSQLLPAQLAAYKGTEDLSQNEIERYMNPYLDLVGRQAERELTRQGNIKQLDINAAAKRGGAFGDLRHGVVQSEHERNLGRTLSDMWEKTYATGYDKAIGSAKDFRSQQLQSALGLGQLTGQSQNLAYQDINSLLGSGAMQQEQEQKNLGLAYEDFQRQQNYPWEQLGKMSGVLNAAPYSTTTTGTTTGTSPGLPSQGFFQQAAGLGIAGLGTASNLGWKPLKDFKFDN